jgi:polyhydroxybutyrate depolymerase
MAFRIAGYTFSRRSDCGRGRALKKVLRIFLWGVFVVVVLCGALFFYFIDSPRPKIPQLSGQVASGTIQVGGLTRTYLTYIPQGLPKGSPLVVVMHGSGENGARMRIASGYGFERLADEHRFAVAYPDGYEGYWNACNIVGDYAANQRNLDDVGFLTALAEKLVSDIGIDQRRVFATGISRGGHMALRLAIEAPSRFRAVAAIAANVPTPDNFKCRPAESGTSSVMIMNGTKDPLNPFEGGEVKFFGMFRRGTVRSSRESVQYFADLNKIMTTPQKLESQASDGMSTERLLWHNDTKEVELVAIHGGGHVIPQPYWRFPRILGPTPKEPNGPALIWKFFEQQN